MTAVVEAKRATRMRNGDPKSSILRSTGHAGSCVIFVLFWDGTCVTTTDKPRNLLLDEIRPYLLTVDLTS